MDDLVEYGIKMVYPAIAGMIRDCLDIQAQYMFVYPAYAGMILIAPVRYRYWKMFIPQVRGCFAFLHLWYSCLDYLSRRCGGVSFSKSSGVVIKIIYPASAGMIHILFNKQMNRCIADIYL